jgi:hypothetical protein
MTEQHYQGACHCGAVTFEADMDLGTVINCNCSICEKQGLLLAFAAPDKFKLTAGEDNLGDYRFNKKKIRHQFCKTCGVETFGRRATPAPDEKIAINVRCLKGVELKDLNLKPYDGRKL